MGIARDLYDAHGNDLFRVSAPLGSSAVELALFHKIGFQDPVVYGHLADTLNGKIHILLYVVNDPESPRFDVDHLPDGTPTMFGTAIRNLEAEEAAMDAGLAPGQIRPGLRVLADAIQAFEGFAAGLSQDLYFIEPLYYHNAVLFEKYGFNYQIGRRKMEEIDAGFQEGGRMIARLDGSTPFRRPGSEGTIRSRSWAIHDGILGETFTGITMYKDIGRTSGIRTTAETPY